MSHRSVTVVIPARNEESEIVHCLESVIATHYPNLEIIVVDDASTDKTGEAVSDHHTTLVKRTSRGGIAAARNSGIQVARGEIVAFVDADCTVEDNWLDLLTSHYGDEKVAGVGGIIRTKKGGLLATYRSYRDREVWADEGKTVETSDIPGGNSSYRANVLREIGGFNPAFAQPRGHEAFEIGHRIRKKGYRLIGEPRAVVWHAHEDSLKAWVAASYGMGFSALSFLLQYRMRELRKEQVRQIAFVSFLLLLFLGVFGIIPMVLVAYIVFLVALFEIARAINSVTDVTLHYRKLRYLVMFPVEVLLRAVIYVGYVAALIGAVIGILRTAWEKPSSRVSER